MKTKWYIGTLIIFLAFFGVVQQQQTTLPNQEIVLQFTDVTVTSSDAQNTVAVVTKQLQTLGIDNIQINEQEDGKLIISYYSDVDVALIKNILSKENSTAIGLEDSNQSQDTSHFPEQNQSISYNLDIYEIQSYNDIESNLNGSLVELNLFSDQLLNPNVYSSNTTVDVTEKNNNVKVALKVYSNIAIAIDNISYVIPEVRAGPSI